MKRTAKAAFCGLTLTISLSAWGAPGVQEPSSPNYRDPDNVVGLCTSRNKENFYYMSGHCQTILEQLTQNECTKKKVEELRLRVLGDKEKLKAAGIENTSYPDLGFTCEGQNDPANDNLKKLAEDPRKFAIIMMQFFAVMAIEQSDWKVNTGGNTSNQQDVKCESNCGLLGLSKKDMDNEKYKCGCDIGNKTDDQKQFDPTMDGHLNLRCGITIALFEGLEQKDGNILGGGKPKDKDQEQDTRSGMAKIFKSLENIEDKTPDVIDTPRERIREKMKTYCKIDAFKSGEVNTWDQDFENLRDNKDLQSTPATK